MLQEPNSEDRLGLEERDSTSEQLRKRTKQLLSELPSMQKGFSSYMKAILEFTPGLKASDEASSHSQSTTRTFVEFSIGSEDEEAWSLTPKLLANQVSPFLNAITEIQQVIDELRGRPPQDVKVKKISQESPISISLEGAVEAITTISQVFIPWRRQHLEIMAHLLEQEKQAEIEMKRAEVLEKRASAAKSRIEAGKLAAEVAAKQEEAKKMQIENEKLQLELQRAKIQFLLDLINHIKPNLTESERIAYLMKLLPPVDTILASNVEIVGGVHIKGEEKKSEKVESPKVKVLKVKPPSK